MSPIEAIRLTSPKFAYNFSLMGSFTPQETGILASTLNLFFETIGDSLGRVLMAKDLHVRLDLNGGNNFQAPLNLNLNPNGLTQWTIVHELGHALDAAYGWQLSRRMRIHTRSGFICRPLHYARPGWKLFWYHAGSPPPPCGIDKNFNSVEDFAETVTAYLFPDEAWRKAEARGYPYEKWGYTHFHQTPRGKFFQELIRPEIKQTLS